MVHHCCVMSAREHSKPDNILLHYGTEPTGSSWQQTRPFVAAVPTEVTVELFGNPVPHVALRADIPRLRKLMARGEIYLDAHVLVQRCFDDLLGHSTVLG